MAGSINKVILVGNLGKDPEIRAMQDGREICNLTLATSDTWKDKATGERREKTEWHRVVIFNDNLVTVAKNYLKKGAKVYIEGSLQTRKWQDKETGQDKYSTEVVLQGYNGNLTMLDKKERDGSEGSYGASYGSSSESAAPQRARVAEASLDDEIPF